MTTDTYPCPCELHTALADDPNTAAPPFTRLGTTDDWRSVCGHLFAVPAGHTPLSCPVCATLCPVCEAGVHPTQQCPEIASERVRQEIGARVWRRFQHRADFIARLRRSSETEQAIAADALAAYLTAETGTVLGSERVLGCWAQMIATPPVELLAAYEGTRDDPAAHSRAARALIAFREAC